MKILITSILILFAFLVNSQVTVTNTTSPSSNDGSVSIDTNGTKIKKWAVYRVINGSRQDPEISINSTLTNGLSIGTYWVLGKKKTDAFNKFSLDTLINVFVTVVKNCDSLKVTFFNSMQMPDPMNPMNPPNTCISYGIAKATNPLIDKVYTQEGNLPIQTYYGPNQGNCFMNLSPSTKLYVVFKDANGCSVVGTNVIEYKPTNFPVMIVPGTEPGPIINHVTIGVADCSGYYIHYNDVQYKICNSGAATGIIHLDSIVVAGKFLPDCNYVDNTIFCQMYHPFVGYFWLDSFRAIAPKPSKINCWDNYQLNATYHWVNVGTQPTQPTDPNYNYQFDGINCIWNNTGLKNPVLSVNELDFRNTIYPNPFNESLKISSPVKSTIKIYNIIGELIYKIEEKEISINTTDFVKGNYILEITYDNNSYKKLITKN